MSNPIPLEVQTGGGLELARIVNDIQLAYAKRLREGDEVLSTFGMAELKAWSNRRMVTESEKSHLQGMIVGLKVARGFNGLSASIETRDAWLDKQIESSEAELKQSGGTVK